MRIEVTEYEKKYSFDLERVTQLCGTNIIKKTYILESLRRYFSTYKYREEKNKWRDNVKVDRETVGRKYFQVLSVNGTQELLTMIKWSKQSLMMEYAKQLMQKFDWQMHLRTINEELDEMFQIMNDEISKIGNIELTYAMADVWDMIQKSDLTGGEETAVEDQENYELLMMFIRLVEEVVKTNPRKMMIIVENIDHLVSHEEYEAVLGELQKIGMKCDVYFVLSTSIDGYVVCNREFCRGITVFGDVDFQMPEFDRLSGYIQDNYPYYKKISEDHLRNDLEKIIHKIGRENYLSGVEENVVCKLLNQTLMLYEKWENTERDPEIAFLKQ